MCRFLKKAFTAALCCLLLLLLVPVPAEAESFSLRDTVIQEAHDSYYQSQATAGKSSFHGTCGLMVSHQLYNLGINKRRISFDGNDNYDYYSSREKTTGGYYINAYSAEGYTLREALEAVTMEGRRDVKNVLVGFQWTNTEAGAKYGHVMLINGIVNGKVYFVESFDCALGGPEGTVISCSIKEFAAYYDRWTTFEGLIHFGTGTYHDVCPHVTTDITVQTRFPTMLRSEPAVLGEQGCVRLRSVSAGERLRATAIYETEHAYYYRVETNEGYGFIAAAAASMLQVNTERVILSQLALSRWMKPGTVPVFSGLVTDEAGILSSVEVCISDPQGQLLRREVVDLEAEEVKEVQLNDLRDDLFFDLLDIGCYRVEIYASRSCPVVTGSYSTDQYARVLLSSRDLYVGGNPKEAFEITYEQTQTRDGWFRENGAWYRYESNKPSAGWVTHAGIRYYLQPNGAVTTGAQTVEDKQLYFSASGALVTGWLTLEGKTSYRASDGTAVTGWHELEGKLYCFGEDGFMLTDTEQAKDGTTYCIAKDGTATVKPQRESQKG